MAWPHKSCCTCHPRMAAAIPCCHRPLVHSCPSARPHTPPGRDPGGDTVQGPLHQPPEHSNLCRGLRAQGNQQPGRATAVQAAQRQWCVCVCGGGVCLWVPGGPRARAACLLVMVTSAVIQLLAGLARQGYLSSACTSVFSQRRLHLPSAPSLCLPQAPSCSPPFATAPP